MVFLGCVTVYAAGVAAEMVRRAQSGQRILRSGGERRRLVEELTRKKAAAEIEMEKYNSPSTFVQYAKIQREAQRFEKELEEIKGKEVSEKKESSKASSKIVTPMRAALTLFIMIYYWRTPLLSFDCALVAPLGRIRYFFRSADGVSCGLSGSFWFVLCNGVTALLFSYITKALDM